MNFKNGYREIEGYAGLTIEKAVLKLQRYHEIGEKVFMTFNGTELYSDTVTVDSAYLQITGMTKAEYKRKEREALETYAQQEREYQAKIPELTKEWVEKGHAVLDEKYWEVWDEMVPIRLTDLYKGWELGMCLDIVRVLNKGPEFLIEAKNMFVDQGHSGMSYGLVRSMVRSLCDLGEEFFKFTKL